METSALMNQAGPHKSTRIRAISAFALAWLFGSQVAALVHTFVVRHAVCLEHGESIHVSPDETVADAARPASNAASQLARDGRFDESQHQHDSCSLPFECRNPTLAPARLGAMRLQQVARDVGNPRATAVVVSQQTYRIAPKASPPV